MQDALPQDVRFFPINTHLDERGVLAEIYRKEWAIGMDPLQWNLVFSKSNALRGIHLHVFHADYLVLVQGRMTLCLHDARSDSPTFQQTFKVDLKGNHLRGIIIPTGIAHGFYFNEDSILLYSVSEYWNLEDELGCIWNSPEIQMQWPTDCPILSERDTTASSYQEMMELYLKKIQLKEEADKNA